MPTKTFGEHNEDLTVDDLVPRKTQMKAGMLPPKSKAKPQPLPTKILVAHNLIMTICQAVKGDWYTNPKTKELSYDIEQSLRKAANNEFKSDSYIQLAELVGVDTKPENS